MTDSPDTQVLAIDGGGTRCRIALVRGNHRRVIEAGSANVTTDFDSAVRCLREGIETLAKHSDTRPQTLHALPAFVGLAGVTGQTIVDRLTTALPLQNVHYADDRLAALRGALGRGDGLVAHCGTGSFFAAQLAGTHRLAGGWGSVLGDEASAQWVGRAALSQLLHQVDGFIPISAMIEEFRTQFSTATEIVEFARTATPAAFGALAPQVTAHAQTGDPAALKIMQRAAEHITLTLTQMGWTTGTPICLTGGIGPHYAPYFPDPLKGELSKPLGEPLDGAIALAQERGKEIAHGHC
ncbi:BadF/BadG/BcrA/BcrD ATPase family protein [Ruegeria sp. 2205SS24-7]|uniref:BadF/BadG/BcrA/BcrD ATPase family protein n=1 Tax=Ruegeria discodermiae TaxID=3064389 RepID=UPI0027407C4C|nr:BadF/BadG/BcrA/BcrD ATPase family protein [Ruegeria sp. 2205SS24-7]MDP5220891.1 BadF/BadG/BcrA/BcrD ATPase family protein [Ruegeria sp. 2205SS24-7]